MAAPARDRSASLSPGATIVIDLTPLDTPTRAHGIGRYLHDLCVGLEALAPAERAGLRLYGLTHLGWTGSFELTEQLGSFRGSPALPSPRPSDRYRWAYRRRVALWRALRTIRPDWIHLGDPNATPLGMDLAGCRRLVTCHDLIPLEYPEQYFSWKDGFRWVGPELHRRRYRSADHVVAISDATANALRRLVGIAPERLSRVYNGVPLERWSPTPSPRDDDCLRRLGLEPRRFVTYVGNVDWRKNLEGMVGGLAHARRAGVELTLVHAGRVDGAKRARLGRLAERYGVSRLVRSVGYCDDPTLGALYRHAIANLFVSRAEGFGLPLVEAMATGCPTITTRCGSLAEVAGEAALTVDPESHRAIGEAMVQLARDAELRAELSRRGIARAPRFSLRAQALAMVALYRRLAALREPPGPRKADAGSPPPG